LLHVRSAHDDARVIPLADRVKHLGRDRRNQVIQTAGRAIAVASRLRVRVEVVVDDLVFEADAGPPRLHQVLGDEILDARVAARSDLPIDAQLEVVVLVRRDDVAAARPLAGRLQTTVRDRPAVIRKGGAVKPAPAIRRGAVEQQLPAGGPFGGTEDVRRLLRGHRHAHGHDAQRHDTDYSCHSPHSTLP
jgi:hypothetical protein